MIDFGNGMVFPDSYYYKPDEEEEPEDMDEELELEEAA